MQLVRVQECDYCPSAAWLYLTHIGFRPTYVLYLLYQTHNYYIKDTVEDMDSICAYAGYIIYINLSLSRQQMP